MAEDGPHHVLQGNRQTNRCGPWIITPRKTFPTPTFKYGQNKDRPLEVAMPTTLISWMPCHHSCYLAGYHDNLMHHGHISYIHEHMHTSLVFSTCYTCQPLQQVVAMQTRNVEYGDIKLKTVTRKQTVMERYDPHYTRPIANLDFEAFENYDISLPA